MATKTPKRKQPPPGMDGWGDPIIDILKEDEPITAEPVSIDRPKTSEEILWTEYAIQPNLPLRTKVEQLMLLWRLPATIIARLLGITVSLAESELAELNKEWMTLGRPLDDESRQIVRGRIIAELIRLKTDLDSSTDGNPDARLLALKLQVIDKLTKLQGLDLDRKEPAYEETSLDPVQVAIDALSEERRGELLAQLKKTSL